jgi:hypothetical protein
VGGQHHAPTALPPGKTRYPLYRRLGGIKAVSRLRLIRKFFGKTVEEFQTFIALKLV